MINKRITSLLLLSVIIISTKITAQVETQNICRISLINPAIEYELAILKKSTITSRVGWGLSGSYSNLDLMQTGWIYMLVPYADLEYKNLYNIQKRATQGKKTQGNSTNYWGIRSQYRTKATRTNIARKDNNDFSIGPMWGLQHSYGKIHLLCDIGGVYYFDTKGNNGVMYTVNLRMGINLWEKD